MSRLAAKFRAPRPGDAEELEANLRFADSVELTALGHSNHLAALRESLARSTGAAAVGSGSGITAAAAAEVERW